MKGLLAVTWVPGCNPEKEQFLHKILAISGPSLNPNTTNPQKNLANLLCGAPLAEKRQVVVWHDFINSFINSYRTNDLRACTAQELTEILKLLTNINAIVYYQGNGYQEPADQLGYFFSIHITRCLISKRRSRTELVDEYQALDVQLELKSLWSVFEHQDNLPAVFSKLRSRTKKESQTRRRAEKRRLVNRGEETVGPTDEEASTERVS